MNNKIKKRDNHFKRVFHIIVIAVAIVSLWRGVWGLMDLYLFPGNSFISYFVSFVIGAVILYESDYLLERLI